MRPCIDPPGGQQRRGPALADPDALRAWELRLEQAGASIVAASGSAQGLTRSVQRQLSALGLRGSVSLRTGRGMELSIALLAHPPARDRLLSWVERVSGLRVLGYTFDAASVQAYGQVLRTGQAQVLEDTGPLVQQILPPGLGPLLRRTVLALREQPVALLPLRQGAEVVGVMAAAGEGLQPGRVPALQRLAENITGPLCGALPGSRDLAPELN